MLNSCNELNSKLSIKHFRVLLLINQSKTQRFWVISSLQIFAVAVLLKALILTILAKVPVFLTAADAALGNQALLR